MTRRKIVIGSKEYQYFIGLGSIVIWNPNGTKEVVDQSTLTGRSWDVIERGQWKKTSDGEIRPSDIRKYIERTRGVS